MNDYDASIIAIGGKGHLDAGTLQRMAPAVAMVVQQNPGIFIMLMLDGYDDDPRSLWDIPEAAAYIRRYAKAAGLWDWQGTLFQALDEHSKALLLACKAIRQPCPFDLEIVP